MTASAFTCPEGVRCLSVAAFALIVWLIVWPKWPLIALAAKAAIGGALAMFFLFVAPAVRAQEMTREEAKDEAKDLAEGLETQIQDGATQDVNAASVPSFVTDDPYATDYYDNPAGLESDGLAAMGTNEASGFVTDSMTSRPVVSSTELDTWTANGLAVEADATSIVSEYSGTYGDCTTTITGGTTTRYSYSCNEGETLLEFTGKCQIPLTVSFTSSYVHECLWTYLAGDRSWEPSPYCAAIAGEPSCGPLSQTGGGTCLPDWKTGAPVCTPQVWQATCGVEVIDGVAAVETILGAPVDSWDASSCDVMESDANCSLLGDICIEPTETRLIDGVSVTRDCWKWERSYQCASLGGVINDCDVPDGCVLSESVCLSIDDVTGECRAWEHTYSCETAGAPGAAVGYCEEDVYCIDGDCETLVRPQNDEFHQAVSALAILGQLEDDADAATLEVFPGEYGKCDKVVAGLQNCCANDGFLTAIGFGCSADDIALAQKVDAGLCHYNGTYCSKKTLFGICLKKRKTFCCFNNILARLIHEQGRPQIGLDWGTVKDPDCSGFTVALFQQLDLSVMDFSEFYNDMLATFTPPDGAAAADAITQRIIDAYSCPPNC